MAHTYSGMRIEIYGNKDGTIPATFQILYMIGWRPDPSQPKPLPRGSGEISFKALSEAPEVIAAQLANEKEPKKTE